MLFIRVIILLIKVHPNSKYLFEINVRFFFSFSFLENLRCTVLEKWIKAFSSRSSTDFKRSSLGAVVDSIRNSSVKNHTHLNHHFLRCLYHSKIFLNHAQESCKLVLQFTRQGVKILVWCVCFLLPFLMCDFKLFVLNQQAIHSLTLDPMRTRTLFEIHLLPNTLSTNGVC